MSRIEAVEQFLKRPPRKMERSDSMHNVPRVIERELRVPPLVHYYLFLFYASLVWCLYT